MFIPSSKFIEKLFSDKFVVVPFKRYHLLTTFSLILMVIACVEELVRFGAVIVIIGLVVSTLKFVESVSCVLKLSVLVTSTTYNPSSFVGTLYM